MGISKFYFAIDGPQNERDMSAQNSILIKLEDFCTSNKFAFFVSRLSENRGIFINMFTALEWFFRENSFGIVFEDDTIPCLSFFEFVVSSRMELEKNPKTLMISGWRGVHGDRDSYCINECCSYPLIWGWATTRSKWMLMRDWYFSFDSTNANWKKKLSPSYGFWRTGYKRAIAGKIDSWANVLAYNFFLGNYKSIVPPVSLIENVGLDEFATNSKVVRKRFSWGRPRHRQSTEDLDSWLSREIYRISFRHIFAPVYAPILDYFRRNYGRKPPMEVLEKFDIDEITGLELREQL
jgi:hypothetical protein